MTTAIKSVSIGLELLAYAEKYKISLSEAVRVGVAVMLSELGEIDFINKTNFGRKITKLSGMVQDLQNKLDKYEYVVSKKE